MDLKKVSNEMVNSKEWNWSVVKDSFWTEPSEDRISAAGIILYMAQRNSEKFDINRYIGED